LHILQNSSNIFFLLSLSDSLYRYLISFKYSAFALLLIIIPFYLFNIMVTLFMRQCGILYGNKLELTIVINVINIITVIKIVFFKNYLSKKK